MDFLGSQAVVGLEQVVRRLPLLAYLEHQHRAAFEQGLEVGFVALRYDPLDSLGILFGLRYAVAWFRAEAKEAQESYAVFVVALVCSGEECVCPSDALSSCDAVVLRACLGLLASTA